MAKPRNLPLSERLSKNRRRDRPSFAEVIRDANQRAHDVTNRRLARRRDKSIQAAIAATGGEFDDDTEEEITWGLRVLRWLMGFSLIPPIAVTFWTFLSQFSSATIDRGIWQTSAFWYFAIGMLVMTGWFLSGLLQPVFLYLYVLGHELTHTVFVYLCRGRVTEFHVGLDGGYITTNKTNLIIALSPYFVPFWSVVVVALYQLLFYTCGLPAHSDKFLFLSVTMAIYRLDRTNTRSTDPNDPTRIVQTGSQRTNGYELGLNGHVAARAAFLHDIGKAIDRDLQGTHLELGLDFLRKHGESEPVLQAVAAHHMDIDWPSLEAMIVQSADAISAARPGARRDILESYVKRLEKLESIADSFAGVSKAFALQAGREIRIVVESEHVSDEQTVWLSKDIARRIENELEYPGQIKVTVIRETRATEFAQ